MIPFRDRMIYCALALGFATLPASASDVEADLACCRKPVVGFRSCYNPCEPVGPIRRFFRTVFRVPCPPPAPPIMVPVPVTVARPAPACAPSTIMPAAPPAVDIGRPVPVNPPLDVPPPTPPAPVSGFGRRPPRLTPPLPPPPVRLDRMASLGGPGPEVTLVHATQSGLKLTTRPDRDGSLTRDLEPGLWLVYTRDTDGRLTFRTKVTAREGVATRVTLE